MRSITLPRPIIFVPINTYAWVTTDFAVGSCMSTVLYEPDYEPRKGLYLETDYQLTGKVIIEGKIIEVKSLLLLDGSLQDNKEIINIIDDFKLRELAANSPLPPGYKDNLLDKFIGKKV